MEAFVRDLRTAARELRKVDRATAV
jgi:hypothetical protein